jgi:hypothetical protein
MLWKAPRKNPYTLTEDGTLVPRGKEEGCSQRLLTLAEAQAAVDLHGLGLGIVPTTDNNLVVVDLDGCRRPETKETHPSAQDLIKQLNSYTEISPSGTGYKVFLLGPRGRVGEYKTHDVSWKGFTPLKEGGLEVWDHAYPDGQQVRYTTVTLDDKGLRKPLRHHDGLDSLEAEPAPTEAPTPSSPPTTDRPLTLADWQGVLRQMKSKGHGKWTACCPAHDDKTPSLVLWEKPDGVAVKCSAGCKYPDIVKAAGLRREKPKKKDKPSARKNGGSCPIPEVVIHEDAQDGEQLLNDQLAFLRRFVSTGEDEILTAALWVGLTHLVGALNKSPFLTINSPTAECGKTTLKKALAACSRKPFTAVDMSQAQLVRIADAYDPTLFLDEMDTYSKEELREIRALLNARYERGEVVPRINDTTREPEFFTCFGPTCLIRIGTWGSRENTLRSRSIIITMERKGAGQRTEEWDNNADGYKQEGADLAKRWARWAQDNATAFASLVRAVDLPTGLNNRVRDNWKPILALADSLAGHPVPLIRQAAVRMAAENETEDIVERLLRDIWSIYESLGADEVPPVALVEALKRLPESDWSEYGYKGLTPKAVSSLLKTFRTPSGEILVARKVSGARVWLKKDFGQAWERHAIGK